MEFEEMKKIWDAQNNQPLYAIDERALHNRIQSNTNTMRHFNTITDWALIMIYLGASGKLIYTNRFKPGANIFMYLEAAWMLAIVVYFVVSYFRRIKAGRQFDRSIHGDLDHAIFLLNYQMHVSQIVRWNFIPMGAIMIFSGWESGKLLKVGAIILVSYALAFYVTSKGYQANKRRKRKLQVLKQKLEA